MTVIRSSGASLTSRAALTKSLERCTKLQVPQGLMLLEVHNLVSLQMMMMLLTQNLKRVD
jgi:hypothetical protein